MKRVVYYAEKFEVRKSVDNRTYIAVFIQGIWVYYPVADGCDPTNVRLVLEYDEVASA
jgi:hypothetical protein